MAGLPQRPFKVLRDPEIIVGADDGDAGEGEAAVEHGLSVRGAVEPAFDRPGSDLFGREKGTRTEAADRGKGAGQLCSCCSGALGSLRTRFLEVVRPWTPTVFGRLGG